MLASVVLLVRTRVHHGHAGRDPVDRFRYTQADPIGLRADASLYSYAGSNPTDGIDPLGLWTLHRSCRGFETLITRAMTNAVAGLSRCLSCGERDRAISSLMDATIKSDLRGTGCANNPLGRAIVLEQGGLIGSAACPCMPALLAHEAAHDLQPWWDNSEGVPEVIENKCLSCGNNDNNLPPPSISAPLRPARPWQPPAWSTIQ